MSGRGTKRSAAAAGLPQSTPVPQKITLKPPPKPAENERPSKRSKTSGPSTPASSSKKPEDFQVLGRTFLEHMKKAVDKHGRRIAEPFYTLPDPHELPDYYKVITLPMAIDTLEEKLTSGQYQTLENMEADVKRLVANAKKYNQTDSQIFEDAERIRKLTFNWMARNNPKAGNQTPATPEPDQIDPAVLKALMARVRTSKPAPSPLAAREPTRSVSIKLQTPAPAAEEDSDPQSFKGKTFQKAQEMVVQQCIDYEENGLDIFTPFKDLPLKRDVKDYYTVITDPQSLSQVLKRVRGKKENGFTSDFKTWDALEAELRKIANNARIYNEDGSEMFNLANEFEEYFKERLAEARKQVPEPPQQTLKLNMGAKASNSIKLRLGQSGSQKGSPAPATLQKSDSPAVNGVQPALPAAVANNRMSTPQSAAASQTISQPLAASGVKTEQQTPVPQASVPQVNGLTNGHSSVMPPPNSLATGNHLTPGAPGSHAAPHQPPAPSLVNGLDSKWRPDGKTAKDALLQDLHVITDPAIRHPNPLSIHSKAQDAFCQRAITVNLAPGHRQLRLEPTFHQSLLGYNPRPFRVFCNVNGNRLSPIPSPGGSNKIAFTVSLVPGMNRIELEVVAAKEKTAEERENMGTQTRSKTTELDIERCSVFAHSLKM